MGCGCDESPRAIYGVLQPGADSGSGLVGLVVRGQELPQTIFTTRLKRSGGGVDIMRIQSSYDVSMASFTVLKESQEDNPISYLNVPLSTLSWSVRATFERLEVSVMNSVYYSTFLRALPRKCMVIWVPITKKRI